MTPHFVAILLYVFILTRICSNNASPYKQVPVECLPRERSFLSKETIETEEHIKGIKRCPMDTGTELKLLCEEEYPISTTPIQELEKMKSDFLHHGKNQTTLTNFQQLLIQKAMYVKERTSENIFANIFCAKCNFVTNSVGFNPLSFQYLPQKISYFKARDTILFRITVDRIHDLQYCKRPLAFLMKNHYFAWEDLLIIREDYFQDLQTRVNYYVKNPTWKGYRDIFTICTWACCGFSFVALVFVIAIFSFVDKLHKFLPDKMLIGLCSTLLVTVAGFSFGTILSQSTLNEAGSSRWICLSTVGIIQTALISSFIWMTALGCELLSAFGVCATLGQCLFSKRKHKNPTGMMLRARRHESNVNSRFRKHLIFACLVPLCFTIPALSINEYAYSMLAPVYNATSNDSWGNISHKDVLGPIIDKLNPGFCPYHNATHAWFTRHTGLIIWFLGPAGSMICFNALALLTVCIQICRLKKETQLRFFPIKEQQKKQQKQSKNLAGICAKLAIILGASWFVQLFAGLWPELDMLRRIVGIVNSAQGGVIAVSMLASSKARRVICKWPPACCKQCVCCKQIGGGDTSQGDGTTSSTTRNRITTSTHDTKVSF